MPVHKVSFEPIDITIDVPEEETVLDAALRQGLWLRHECRAGRCASCKSVLLRGDVRREKYSLFALEEEEIRTGYVLPCRIHPRSDLVVRLPEESVSLLQPARAPVKTFLATVVGNEPLTRDIRYLALQLARGEQLVFRAGQYATIRVPTGGEYRSFSMANTPRFANRLEFLVKVHPGGRFSSPLADGRIAIGQELEVKGPFGTFTLSEESESDLLCVAGGSGLAPLWSLLNDLRERGIRRRATLYYAARTRQDLIYLDRLRELEERLSGFRFVPVLSRPSCEDEWDGESGRINEVIARTWKVGHPKTEAYLCGPSGMIDAILPVLAQKGIAERRIFYDRFTSTGNEG
jgi:propane monooxygenase reductase component